jgi:hypothetical protein
LRWDGEDTVCIVCGYVEYTAEDREKLRKRLEMDELRTVAGRKRLSDAWEARRVLIRGEEAQ